jgi:hypothetical protein
MNTVVRDVVIFVVVLIALSAFSLARSTRRRRGSGPTDSANPADGASSVDGGGPAVGGLAEYAAAQGWTGPSTDLSSEQMARDYVERMLRNLFGAGDGSETTVSGPAYRDLYSGQRAGRRFVVGNAEMGAAGTEHTGSVCVLHLEEALPPLFVNLRKRRPYVRMLLKEMTFESEAFNDRFSVLALDREYASDVITEQTMAILMERDDWVFALEFDRLVCLAGSGLGTGQEYADRLDAVTRFADLIPHFVDQDKGLQMPTLPDGTVLDPADPESRKRFEDALMAMSPEQREQAIAQFQGEGAKFLVGMLGSRLPPGAAEQLEERLAAGDPHAPGGTAPDVEQKDPGSG